MAVIAALTVAALAPTLVVSMMLTQNTLDHIDSTENAEVTDVTDVDPEATVMYTVPTQGGDPYDSDVEFILPSDFADTLRDSDMIKMTVIDQGTDKRTDSASDSLVDPAMEEGCRIKLNLGSDGQHDERTGTYSGYLRITDDGTLTATYTYPEQLENCGIYVIYAD